jgi:hypothetical protein
MFRILSMSAPDVVGFHFASAICMAVTNLLERNAEETLGRVQRLIDLLVICHFRHDLSLQ